MAVFGDVPANQVVADPGTWGSGGGGVPTGVGMDWFTDTPPDGWLLCDGAAVSRATYAALFAVIGTIFGAGDGSTTFNLPDFKGRVGVGKDAGQSEFDALAKVGGAKVHQLTTAEMPSHTHIQNSHNHAQDPHTHVQNSHNHTQDAHSHPIQSQTSTTGSVTSYEHGAVDTSSTKASEGDTTAPTTATNQAATATNQNATATNQGATAVNQSEGGGGSHNNLQPFIVQNKIIKT